MFGRFDKNERSAAKVMSASELVAEKLNTPDDPQSFDPNKWEGMFTKYF